MANDAPRPRPKFGDFVADALRYWEPRRIAYNAVLAAVVLIHFFKAWPASRVFVTGDELLGLFLLMVLFVTGTAFAAVIAHFVSMNALALNLNLLYGSLLSSGA